jgi:hypothetical protein
MSNHGDEAVGATWGPFALFDRKAPLGLLPRKVQLIE